MPKNKFTLYLLCIALISFQQCSPDDNDETFIGLDSLNSWIDVQQFAIDHSALRKEDLESLGSARESLEDSLINRKFIKVDIDNNGLTDLMINHETVPGIPYILAFEDGSVKVKYIPRSGNENVIRQITSSSNSEIILKKHIIEIDANNLLQLKERNQPLMYKFESLLPFNPNPSNLRIDSIRVNYSGGYGWKGKQLSITPLQRQIFSEDSLRVADGSIKGHYSAPFSESQFQTIQEFLNYISFTELEESYNAWHSDDEEITVEVYYRNGFKKTVSDYGKSSNLGFTSFIFKMDELIRTSKWKE